MGRDVEREVGREVGRYWNLTSLECLNQVPWMVWCGMRLSMVSEVEREVGREVEREWGREVEREVGREVGSEVERPLHL